MFLVVVVIAVWMMLRSRLGSALLLLGLGLPLAKLTIGGGKFGAIAMCSVVICLIALWSATKRRA